MGRNQQSPTCIPTTTSSTHAGDGACFHSLKLPLESENRRTEMSLSLRSSSAAASTSGSSSSPAAASSSSTTTTTSWFSGIYRGKSGTAKLSKSASVAGGGSGDYGGGPIKGKNQFRGVLFKYGPKSIQVYFSISIMLLIMYKR